MMEEEGRYRGFDLSDSSPNESVFVSSDDSEDDAWARFEIVISLFT